MGILKFLLDFHESPLSDSKVILVVLVELLVLVQICSELVLYIREEPLGSLVVLYGSGFDFVICRPLGLDASSDGLQLFDRSFGCGLIEFCSHLN